MRARKKRFLFKALIILSLPLFFLACLGEADAPSPSKEPIIVSRGIITAAFNRYVEKGANTPYEQFSLLGVFARFDIEESGTVESLFDSRLTDVDLDPDSCSMPAPVLNETGIYEQSGKKAIELLDAGNLQITFGKTTKPIPTRTFPDLLRMIVGVLYTADETKGVSFRPGETYTLRASGTADIEPFQVALEAPQDLGEVKVNGVIPGDQVPVLRRQEDIELTWDSGDVYGDEIIAELSWTKMGSPWSMMCRMRDNGVFVIPSAYSRQLPDPLTSSDEELTLSRVRQFSFFRSASLLSGSFRFIVSTNFPVSF